MKNTVGISDIRVYVPQLLMNLNYLVEQRSLGHPELSVLIKRGCKTTGQQSFRFTEQWQDTCTLAAQSARLLFCAHPECVSSIRYLLTGTETAVDMSKPVSAYVQGMLQSSNIPLPEHLATFQLQHACAGGTYGVLALAALLATGGQQESKGLVMCSDIARYEYPSVAELTQGSGAVSILLEQNPRLLEIDLENIGYASRDVDDFFRPLSSFVARVRGAYSVECYKRALESAFLDYCRQRNCAPADMLRTIDYFVLHIPFYSMGYIAMNALIRKYLGLKGEQAVQYLDDKGFQSQLRPVREIGNTYTCSVYLSLFFLLHDRLKHESGSIAGRSILVASYGSGNTMAVFSCTIAARAAEVIHSWNPDALLQEYQEKDMESYLCWLENPNGSAVDSMHVPKGHYYLASLRDDGYREYKFKS